MASLYSVPEEDGKARLRAIRPADGRALDLQFKHGWSFGSSAFPGAEEIFAPAEAGAFRDAFMHTIIRVPYSAMHVRQEAAPP